MIVSMTGYGRKKIEYNGKNISIEIKSLNSRNTDVSMRIPGFYREKESEIREILTQNLNRGKIDFSIYVELGEANLQTCINKDLASKYLALFSEICKENNIQPSADLITSVMRIPEVSNSMSETLEDKEWAVLKAAILESVDSLKEFRKQEGQTIGQDIKNRINVILDKLKEVEKFEPNRTLRVRERILQHLSEVMNGKSIDEDRLEQELIYFVEKLDITEEKVRLKQHCNYFIETCENEEMAGRKLNFITQELGREINTLGSKANDSDIQKIVVEMKDELEKIKEQLFNVL